MALEELNDAELDALSEEDLRTETDSLDADAESLASFDAEAIRSLGDLCGLYREHIRTTLRKIRNTLKHPIVRAIVGGGPARAVGAVMDTLDRICNVQE